MLSSSVIFVYSLRRWCVIIIFVIVYYCLYRAICQQSFIVFVIFIHDSVSPSSTAHRESTMTDGQCRKPRKDPEGEVPAFVRHIQNSNRIKLSCTGIMHHDNRYKHTNISPSRAEMRCSSTDGVVAVSELCQSRPKFLWPVNEEFQCCVDLFAKQRWASRCDRRLHSIWTRSSLVVLNLANTMESMRVWRRQLAPIR